MDKDKVITVTITKTLYYHLVEKLYIPFIWFIQLINEETTSQLANNLLKDIKNNLTKYVTIKTSD